jgi:hypothetical protein
MDNRTATRRPGGVPSFVRVIRSMAEASLVVIGFAFAILLIGTPFALLVSGVHEGLTWLVGARGNVSDLVDALVSVSAVAVAATLAVVLVKLLVGFIRAAIKLSARSRAAAP